MLTRNYNAMRPAFSDVIDTQEYRENKIKEIGQGLIDIRNEKNPRLRAEITKNLVKDKKKHLLRLASLKEETIKSIDHPYDRAYKELFHFSKFPFVKRKPKLRAYINDLGQKQIQAFTEHINFQGVELEITYYGGELGDPDRMVWLAVMNNGIRHLDFIKEFGWIPYSRTGLAIDAGFNEKRTAQVSKSLEKLCLTRVKFINPFGKFAYKGGFHMLDTVQSTKVKDLKSQVHETLESKNIITDKVLINQTQKMMESIKPKTPKINLLSFHNNLMQAITANCITTIDNWALNKLSDVGEKTLFLYFYDIAQWYKCDSPKKMNIFELIALTDTKPQTRKAKGKMYTDWKRTIKQLETFINNVQSIAKFILHWEWVGEKENTMLRIYIDNDVRQIPAAPPKN